MVSDEAVEGEIVKMMRFLPDTTSTKKRPAEQLKPTLKALAMVLTASSLQAMVDTNSNPLKQIPTPLMVADLSKCMVVTLDTINKVLLNRRTTSSNLLNNRTTNSSPRFEIRAS